MNTTTERHKHAKKIRVLLVFANPVTQARLALEEEIRAIKLEIRKGRYRDWIEFDYLLAARFSDVLSKIELFKPHVLQFSGHGIDGGYVFIHPKGGADVVQPDSLKYFLSEREHKIEYAVFNFCGSMKFAKALAGSIKTVVGMDGEPKDKASYAFSLGFFTALAQNGPSLSDAFKAAFRLGKTLAIKEDPMLVVRLLEPQGEKMQSWDDDSDADDNSDGNSDDSGPIVISLVRNEPFQFDVYPLPEILTHRVHYSILDRFAPSPSHDYILKLTFRRKHLTVQSFPGVYIGTAQDSDLSATFPLATHTSVQLRYFLRAPKAGRSKYIQLDLVTDSASYTIDSTMVVETSARTERVALRRLIISSYTVSSA